MAYYNYKRVAHRADFISATVEWSEQTGEEFEGTADYDGDVYCVAEFLLDKKDEEIARLRDELEECRRDAERYRWLRDPKCTHTNIARSYSGDDMDREIDRVMRSRREGVRDGHDR